jgi:hypothetical protein
MKGQVFRYESEIQSLKGGCKDLKEEIQLLNNEIKLLN